MRLTGKMIAEKREITFLAGAQLFLNDKGEIVQRKTPNLTLSYYDCVKQLRCIQQKIEDFETAASFFEGVLNGWEEATKDLEESQPT